MAEVHSNVQDLYIGNPTKQVLQFAYLPVDPRNFDRDAARPTAKFLHVPVGGQSKIPDLEEVNLNWILRQHEQYGMIEYTEIDRQREKVSIIYSVGRPIPAKALEKAVHRNENILSLLGKEVRQQAAVAGHQALNTSLDGYNTPTELKALEVDVVETSRDQRDNSPEVNDGVRVVADPVEAAPRRARRRA